MRTPAPERWSRDVVACGFLTGDDRSIAREPAMRDLHELDRYRLRGERVRAMYGSEGDAYVGAFAMPSPIDGRELVIVASNDAGWDHVSVSRQNRAPNWIEM